METESGDGAFFMPLRRTPEYTRQVNMRVRSVDRSVFLTASGKGTERMRGGDIPALRS
ncbi:MAG TPA: hypothetical protein PLN32_09880 [Methanoregulaceae archaeon]|nr:hypothetical protein [Methanoregulaceae archaeon]